jgi:hypothetical protein
LGPWAVENAASSAAAAAEAVFASNRCSWRDVNDSSSTAGVLQQSAEVGRSGEGGDGGGWGRREDGGGREGGEGKGMIREEREEGGEKREGGELCMWGKGGRNHIKITFASLRINKFSLHKLQHFKLN